MSDWISKAAKKNRQDEEKRRQKKERQLAKESRRKHQEEEIRNVMQRWLEHYENRIMSTYQLIETHMKRAEVAGFQVSSKRSTNGRELSIYAGEDRSIDFTPNYDNGFEVIFSIMRYYNDPLGNHHEKKKKRRNYAFDKVSEEKILSWIKWVATGKRPFWLV